MRLITFFPIVFPFVTLVYVCKKLPGPGAARCEKSYRVRGPRPFPLFVNSTVLLDSLTREEPWSSRATLGSDLPRVRKLSRGSLASRGKGPVSLSSPLIAPIPAPPPHSPHVVPLETVYTAESLLQTQQPGGGGGFGIRQVPGDWACY